MLKQFFKNILFIPLCVSVCINPVFAHAPAHKMIQCESNLNPPYAEYKGTVVIVAAYSTGADIAPKMRQMGVQSIIHVEPWGSEETVIFGSFRPQDFEQNIIHDGNFNALLTQLKKYNVTAVLAGTETGVDLANALSHALKLPGNPPENSETYRNKWLQHEALRKNGVNYIHGIKSMDLNEILTWISSEENNGQYPVVVKPLNSAGTQNVFICKDESDVRAAFSTILQSKNVFGEKIQEILVQEFIEGPEYVVNPITQNGRSIFAEQWLYEKYEVPRPEGGMTKIYLGDYILDLYSPTALILEDYAQKVLNALGIVNGPSHIEIIMSKRGPVLVEIGTRLMGGHSHIGANQAYGTSALDLTIESYLNPASFQKKLQENYKPSLKKAVRHIDLLVYNTGIITEFVDVERITNLPTYYHHQLSDLGSELVQTVDMLTSPGNVWLVSDNAAAIAADVLRLREIEKNLFRTVPKTPQSANLRKLTVRERLSQGVKRLFQKLRRSL